MNSNQENIYRPSGLDRAEGLKLPPVVRQFEAEPLRDSDTVEDFRDSSGRLHKDDGYAVRLKDGSQESWRHGHAHSVSDAPAIYVGRHSEIVLTVPVGFGDNWRETLSLKQGSRIWCDDGIIHRDGGPAIESGSYREFWCQGRRHRDNGPAFFGLEERWYHHGLIHRADGPATREFDSSVKHYCVWVWYGEKFSTSEGFDADDFPYHEPPPVFYMTALANMRHEPDLPPEAEEIVVGRIAELMPDFSVRWSLRGVCGWDEIRQSLVVFSEAYAKGSTANMPRLLHAPNDVLPLPIGVGDEEHPRDAAGSGKGA